MDSEYRLKVYLVSGYQISPEVWEALKMYSKYIWPHHFVTFLRQCVDQYAVYVGYACSIVIGLAGQNGISWMGQNGVVMKQC